MGIMGVKRCDESAVIDFSCSWLAVQCKEPVCSSRYRAQLRACGCKSNQEKAACSLDVDSSDIWPIDRTIIFLSMALDARKCACMLNERMTLDSIPLDLFLFFNYSKSAKFVFKQTPRVIADF